MKKSLSLFLYKGLIIAFAGLVTAYGPLTLAAEAGKDTLQGYLMLIMEFLNFIIIPLLFSIALLFFLINAARYFILNGADSEAREQARLLALYGIGAFVFLVSIWGIVNMLADGLGFNNEEAICPDYLDGWCGEGSESSSRSGYDYYGSGSDDYYYTPETDDSVKLFFR